MNLLFLENITFIHLFFLMFSFICYYQVLSSEQNREPLSLQLKCSQQEELKLCGSCGQETR